MTRFAICAAAVLAACSPEPEEMTAAVDAPTGFAPVEVAATPPKAAPAPVIPRPGELKTFGDWAVGCDNILRCELRSLGTQGTVPGEPTVSIARAAGPDGTFETTIDGFEDPDVPLAVDGKPVPRAGMVEAIANGRILALMAGGKAVATVSLNGAAAALRYVDAVQGRAGTVTAAVARGSRPASAVPDAPRVPEIVAVKPGGTAARPTPAQLAEMRRQATCSAGGELDEPQAHALGGGKTLVLLPCSAGAYNMLSAVFVLDGGRIAPARADAPIGFEADAGVPTVVNGGFANGLLGSFAKARGLGDCGVIQSFAWDGARMRLSLQQEMGECRGNTVFITTWRAKVVRR